MDLLMMVAVFLVLIVLNVPIAHSIMVAGIVYFFTNPALPTTVIIQKLISGANNYTLLAVPLFMLAGNLMNYGGITKRIFRFANAMVGRMPGGLGQVNIMTSVLFSGMSGSANADAAGLGLIEIQAMRDAGFDDDFTLGITAASSLIGPIIPPSVPAILYATTASVSVGAIFLGGFIPGLVMALALSLMTILIAKKRHYPVGEKVPAKLKWKIFVDAIPSLLTPVIIIGGLWTGWFTATESAAIAALYAAFLSIFVYKDIKIRDLPEILYKSAYNAVPFIFVVCASMVFGWAILREQAGYAVAEWLLSVSTNKYVILFLLNIIMLIMGTFMDPAVSILLLVPVLTPILKQLGIDMVHFGIVMIINLMIGLMTPPVGSILNTLCTVSGASFEKVFKSSLIFLIPLIIALLLITYIPGLVLFLPNLI